ncbi:MAG: imidazole glycerol phosphate synthase subunit HisF [Taibaiella sp.]|jgi:cyclase
MLKKRIIPCLDIKDGRTVKGVNFEALRDAGDPVALARKYVMDGADELVFLDISATLEKRKTLSELVKRIAREINIPFTVGGGISTLEDVDLLIQSGADKVSLNSAAVSCPQLIQQIADKYGSQCVVVAIDTKVVHGKWMVFVQGGKVSTPLQTIHWAAEVAALGAGEILLTSMNNDGTGKGFALDITSDISSRLSIPVIASGGAGCKEDFNALFEQTKASAALAASIFHYDILPVPTLKKYLRTQNIPIR